MPQMLIQITAQPFSVCMYKLVKLPCECIVMIVHAHAGSALRRNALQGCHHECGNTLFGSQDLFLGLCHIRGGQHAAACFCLLLLIAGELLLLRSTLTRIPLALPDPARLRMLKKFRSKCRLKFRHELSTQTACAASCMAPRSDPNDV